ncbi:hypothetical protein T06_7988 [Trichinella sp. T6]|nr:hypothetical protein T06_7988 [Trichinella sp. T6]
MPEQSVGEYTQRLRHDLERLYEKVRGRLAESSGARSFGKTGRPMNQCMNRATGFGCKSRRRPNLRLTETTYSSRQRS